MSSCTYNCFMNVINIGNSIIGVSILAMPYCFRKCGILLSIVLIFISGILTRIACYLLLKSAIMARRRNFEFLAFHTFGSSGKIAVEISVIGFLIGVCIAFFVVIGDLGPPLAAEFLMIDNSPKLRTNLLMLIGLCVALPLGMLRKIDSLTSLSALSIAFYACLILKIFAEAVPNLSANEWWHQVNWWNSEGILPCLPIFSMALSCQTQLFEFFDTSNDPSLKRMQSVIAGAVHLCSTVYIMVGTLGYIAFHDKTIAGNILVLLTPSMVTEVIKLGFIVTVAVSFPLCLFPCRSSLHSLIFKQGFGHHDINITAIPEFRFRILTISLVVVTIGIAIMVPNIEFVLGIIGSTIGTLICLIFPALMFIHDTSKNTTEKRLAQMLVGIGIFILIACTYSTLQEEGTQPKPVLIPDPINMVKVTEAKSIASSAIVDIIPPSLPSKEESIKVDNNKVEKPPDEKLLIEQKRLEPPVPQEPESKVDQNADLDPQALRKEDKEIQKETVSSLSSVDVAKKEKSIDKQENILRKLEEQHKEQQLILEEQKKVLKELKLHKEIHEEQRKIIAEKPFSPEPIKDENISPLKQPVGNKNIIKNISDSLTVKQPSEKPFDTAIMPDNIPKQEEKKFIPILNVSQDNPLNNIVEKEIPKNFDIQDDQKALKQKPLPILPNNITAYKVDKPESELSKKPVPMPLVTISEGIKSAPDIVIKEFPKANLAGQEELKISADHIIKRETLGKIDEPSYVHNSKNDNNRIQEPSINNEKIPT